MAGSINKVILVGNLGRDPEIRHTNAGQKIANLSVATSDTWRDKAGERQERTEWHRVVVFNANLADFAERYLHKGSKVYIEGALQTRKFTDQSGADRYTTEVVLGAFRGELVILDSRSDGSIGMSSGSNVNSMGTEAASSASGWDSTSLAADNGDSFEDEIPF